MIIDHYPDWKIRCCLYGSLGVTLIVIEFFCLSLLELADTQILKLFITLFMCGLVMAAISLLRFSYYLYKGNGVIKRDSCNGDYMGS